jgi:hypothetical protein
MMASIFFMLTGPLTGFSANVALGCGLSNQFEPVVSMRSAAGCEGRVQENPTAAHAIGRLGKSSAELQGAGALQGVNFSLARVERVC